MVLIGIDPHKASHTAVVIDESERELARVKVSADKGQVGALLDFAASYLYLAAPGPNAHQLTTIRILGAASFAARFRPRVLSTTLALAQVPAGRRAGYVTERDLRDSVHFASGIAVCQLRRLRGHRFERPAAAHQPQSPCRDRRPPHPRRTRLNHRGTPSKQDVAGMGTNAEDETTRHRPACVDMPVILWDIPDTDSEAGSPA